jgi:hypothetical protein
MSESLDVPFSEPESASPEGTVFLVIDKTEPVRPLSEVHALVAIDLDELIADTKDPEWQDFLHRAVAYRKELRARGRLD